MLTRLISGILLLIILAFAMSNGGIVLYALTLFISLVGFSELVKATNVQKKRKSPPVLRSSDILASWHIILCGI